MMEIDIETSTLVKYYGNMSELIKYPKWKKDEKYTIPDGVRTIREYAIVDNGHLAELVIPESVTHIENFAVYKNYYLRTVKMPTTPVQLDDYAFILNRINRWL